MPEVETQLAQVVLAVVAPVAATDRSCQGFVVVARNGCSVAKVPFQYQGKLQLHGKANFVSPASPTSAFLGEMSQKHKK